ncbi:MAG: peptide chain release factor 3 [Bacteroidia bacterium]
MSHSKEIARRRTFAIISHPDAGKTTLTEKFLLFGGAIQTAGAVKSNKIKKSATSDFMEIEKQRGISVSTSVMGFEYNGCRVNILDTPGHKDFAEDTFRTLTAVDSVILVVDAAKGVEEQTEKLMGVCRMRNTPVIIFINKMDREGQDPFDLLEELEEKLNIKTTPLTWPISKGATFKGVYNMYRKQLNLFAPNKTGISDDLQAFEDLNDSALDLKIGRYAAQLREEIELAALYPEFTHQAYLSGELAPVFFGSALNNFGIQELLNTFVEIAPAPRPRETSQQQVKPEDAKLSGFVFKIHANLDPNHRDRIAFMRVCSGVFEKNTFYFHPRLKKKFRFSTPIMFQANDRTNVDKAYPGDVVGLYDTGNFKIGDSLTEGGSFFFKGIPAFSPELFRMVENQDPFKAKQFEKGLRQLTDEGVAQLFTQQPGNRKIIGTVGELQFDVIQFRLLQEYGAKVNFRPLSYLKASWVDSEDPTAIEDFFRYKKDHLAFDKDNRPVYLSDSLWMLQRAIEENPKLNFRFSSEIMLSEESEQD